MRRSAGKYFLCAALLAMTAACTGLGTDYDTPTVSVNFVRPLPSEGFGLRFEIGLHIVNPNNVPLELDGAAYSVSLDGFEVISGASNDLPVIDAYSDGDIEIEAQADLLTSMQFVKGLTTKPRESFNYELKAKLSTSLFATPIRIEDTGTISFQP